ncbi:ACP phosphodiesterase [Pseudomonas sp. RTC3]|uniref:acyl carrier protein phosphodiesterase n=1 Tax=unclassified Pseudomonas TaxID=196821 RepID=UPI002AB44B3A|nr:MULTISPECIES: ACP phosphodiesterase [unclassified Pseudomonas]MEB0062367.1 ACP phosphodiesterase [Pseudomonas sp. RTC3]MDY7566363.1 ACP phosphodiesterase [Pseudomonas sp. 5C2]MEB0008336.1 ACP phosphodiesterase [Pseudomonas sp. RTB2]MEB0017829.1 ACP phosphodiesterase [Pseudomonas sp. RTB3]MEB0027832.1 ACP phosphodiesterase [Pseudomonas sp. MH9.2]
MNYLAHLHLGGQRSAQLLGSLYGDFVKGPLPGRFTPELEAAIQLHRSIDSFTDTHPLIKQSIARFPLERRRFAGIVLDVFFDHCLARDWAVYAEQPLDAFTARVYRVLAAEPALPERLALIAPRMAAQDWLGSYREFEVLEQVLSGISRRLSRPQGLAGAMHELQALYQPLSADFAEFYPLLQDFAQAALAERSALG